jgi:hypothetical protein
VSQVGSVTRSVDILSSGLRPSSCVSKYIHMQGAKRGKIARVRRKKKKISYGLGAAQTDGLTDGHITNLLLHVAWLFAILTSLGADTHFALPRLVVGRQVGNLPRRLE